MPTDDQLFYAPHTPRRGPAYLTAQRPARSRYRAPTSYLERPDAIVIGSGIGGLSIASFLAQRQQAKVLVLEANSVPGGCTHCHELDGFEFNSGIDSIGDMDPRLGRGVFRQTIDYITGGQLEWARMPDLHEVCGFGDERYDWYSSPEKNIEWVERRFPGEGRVREYYRLEDQIQRDAWAWAATKVFPEWVPRWLREGFYRLFGGEWRALMSTGVTHVFRERLGFSERLASIFSYMYGNHGRSPGKAPFSFHAANLFHYRDGAYYPVGGPGQIAECIIPIIEVAGGQVAVSSRVQRVLVEGNTAVGVELTDGRQLRAPVVISDASAHTTLVELLPEAVARRHGYLEKFDEVGPSPSHLYLFLGYDEALDLPPQIFWHMPEYRNVDRYDLETADELYKGTALFEGMGGYLLSPSARDPVYAQRYPNKSTVIVLAEAIPAWVDRARTDAQWLEQFKQAITPQLLRIVHRYMPQLRDKQPAFLKAGVPMGCSVGAWHGCSLGLEPSAERFVKHTHWLRPRTKVKNLWLTGQDAFSAGFCGSMFGGRVTYAAMTGNWSILLKPFLSTDPANRSAPVRAVLANQSPAV